MKRLKEGHVVVRSVYSRAQEGSPYLFPGKRFPHISPRLSPSLLPSPQGKVKGTAFDQGDAKIEPGSVADAFWKLNEDRKETVASVADP